MTDQKPNCSTCAVINDDRCPIEFATDKCAAWRTTQITGCLSHPDARAYLMRDVIEELERRIRLLDDFIERVPEYRDAARNTGYKECVKIIRDEVKK